MLISCLYNQLKTIRKFVRKYLIALHEFLFICVSVTEWLRALSFRSKGLNSSIFQEVSDGENCLSVASPLAEESTHDLSILSSTP